MHRPPSAHAHVEPRRLARRQSAVGRSERRGGLQRRRDPGAAGRHCDSALPLTAREREIVTLVGPGHTHATIAVPGDESRAGAIAAEERGRHTRPVRVESPDAVRGGASGLGGTGGC